MPTEFAAAVSWSSGRALEAGNYMYIMSYAFHDDGTIAFRVGATGQNLPGAPLRGPRS